MASKGEQEIMSERLGVGKYMIRFISYYKDSSFYAREMGSHCEVITDLNYNRTTQSIENSPLGQKQGNQDKHQKLN